MNILKDRAVIYTRFSSKMQKKTSTEGQILQGQKLVDRNEWCVIKILSDEAKSGQKERKREAYQTMLAMARNREFDYLIVEQTNRLCRTTEITRVWKMLNFNMIELWDCQKQAPLTETDVSIAALYNSIYRPQLADFVRRGHETALKNGKWPGALPYGYRRIEGIKGSIERDPVKEKVVIRIYREYVAGVSTRTIAINLNNDGICAPGGGKWNFQTLTGGRHGRGIIGNPIYIGKMLWNTHTTVVDPETELDQKRKTPEEKHVSHERKDLRIISQDLWDAAQQVRKDRAVKIFGASGKPKRRAVIPRNNEHPLCGTLYCAVCGGSMRIAQSSRNGAPRAACANAHQRSTCEHTRSFDMDVLLEDVASEIGERLTTPKMVKAAYEAWKDERKQDHKKEGERARLEREERTLTTEIERLSHALAKMKRRPEELYKVIDETDAKRDNVREQLKSLGNGAVSNVVPFDHPNFASDYCADVQRLVEALRTNPRAIDTRLAFKTLVGAVVVKPSPKRMPYRIETKINSATFGMRLYAKNRPKPAEIAASAWYDNVNPANSVLTLSQQGNSLISLGEWQRAA